jgi:muramoyltetrapeptide carboxypeptidase
MLPPRLKPGETISVISPASCPDRAALRRGIRTLEARGYRVVTGKHLGEKADHLAGRDWSRLEDLHAAFADPAVRAIVAARGGSGCTRLLDRVDYRLISRNPKILVGYSDLTALQLAILAKTGLITFSGPMVATDFDGLRPFTARHFWPLVELPQPPALSLKRPLEFAGRGVAQGPIVAGTLSILQTILGTPYMPALDGAILVLEDIHESTHRIDRMLAQLRLAGVWDRVAGVVFATWADCSPRAALERTLRHTANLIGKPVAFGLPYGHVSDKLTLPQGVPARLDATRRTLDLLEGAVT